MRLLVAACLAGAALLSAPLATPAAAAHAHRDVASGPAPGPAPSTTTFTEQTADPPVHKPAAPSCTEQVIVHHQFHSSYYQPAVGTLAPPSACPAPWSAVVLSFDAGVGGVQFDRLADVYVGAVNVFSTSTSEPCCTPGATVSWSWQKDVTEYVPLFTGPEPVTVILNNVNDSTYTGVYDVSVAFTFYETGAAAPPAAHPDVIVPVSNPANTGGDGFYTLTAAGQLASQRVTLPRNLLRLQGELFAQGHGACEEFWWSEPSQCNVGTPYREVTISIDGRLAGAAPVYPVVFTGADGPGLWEPIPSPRAWNLRAYRVDLTPFVGTLVDGAPHAVALGVIDASYPQGDYWLVGANLLGWVDGSATQTSGALDSASGSGAPSESSTPDPSGNSGFDLSAAQHVLAWSGRVTGSAGTAATSVREWLSDTTDETAATVASYWDWRSTVASGATTTTSDSTYSLTTSALTSFTFTDANTTSVSGSQPWSSSYDEVMTTADTSGLAFNGAECESYRAADSSGAAYRRTLLAAAGNIVADVPAGSCSIASTPAASVPETPAPALALMIGAAALVLRAATAGRRSRRGRRRR